MNLTKNLEIQQDSLSLAGLSSLRSGAIRAALRWLVLAARATARRSRGLRRRVAHLSRAHLVRCGRVAHAGQPCRW